MKKTKWLLAGLLLAGVQSWGASITWDSARNITSTNEMPNLTVVSAINAGSGNTITWEGVTFAGIQTQGNGNFYFDAGGKYPGFIQGLPIPRVDGDKKNLLTSGHWDSNIMVVSNLVVGQDYTIQIWSSDSRYGYRYREMTIDDGNSNTVTLRENVHRIEGGMGQYVLGTFTADATTQSFSFSQENDQGPDGASLVNAVALFSGTATFAPAPVNTSPNESATMEFDGYARPINGSSDLLSLPVHVAMTVGGSSDVTLGGVVFQADGASNVTVLGTKTTSGLVPGPQGSTDPVVSQDAIDLLDSGRTNSGGIFITGLSSGTTYTVQIWANDSRTNVTYEETCIDATDREVRNNMQATENSLGQYQLGKFVANGDSQVIRVGDSEASVVNAIVVYEGDYTFDTNPPSVLPSEPPKPPTSWETPENITGNDDFLGLPLIKAINAGTNTITVGGITFTPDNGTLVGGGVKWDFFISKISPDWKTQNPEYTALLDGTRLRARLLKLSNLTVGQTYTIQIWVNDSRSANRTVIFSFDDDDRSEGVRECIPANNNLGQYVIAVFEAETSSLNINIEGFQENSPNVGAAILCAYALYEGAPATSGGFGNWVAAHGLSGSDAEQDADPDSDGLNNLYEYGLGGDPTDAADQGTSPRYRKLAGAIQYVYPARTDDADLNYYLEVNSDLIYGTWTNSGYTAVSGPSGTPDWDSVTNSIPTDVAEKYIRLMITHP